MSLTIIISFVVVLLLAEVLRSHRHLRRYLSQRKKPRPLQSYPSISVIRPIKGLDAGLEENLQAALNTGYPGEVETIFVFDDTREPALALVRKAIVDHHAAGRPGTTKILFAGRPPANRTGKLNAMIAGLELATGELVAFVDSDTRPDADALRVVVESLMADEQAGAAFAPVVASETPETAGDAGYALLLNGLYSPAAAATAARNDGTLPFIMGQFMVLRREAIQAIGGLEDAEGQLVDDMYLGARLHEEGYRNVVAPHSVPLIQRGLPTADFIGTYLRWITFSRSGLPASEFKLASWVRGAVFWAGLVVASVAAVVGDGPGILGGLLVTLAMTASINELHHVVGGGPLRGRMSLVAAGLLLIAPLVLAMVMVRRQVTWRGRTYKLDMNSTLARAAGEQLPDATP